MRKPLMLVVLLAAFGSLAEDAPTLFSYGPPVNGLQPEQSRQYQASRRLGSTRRVRAADVVVEPRAERALRLNLVGSQSFLATATNIEERGGGYTWEGTIEGGGQVILSVSGSRVTGWIWAGRARGGDRFYAISPLGGQAHVIREIDPAWFD